MGNPENFKKESIEELKKKNPSAAKILKSFEDLGSAVLPDKKEPKAKEEPLVKKHYGRGMVPEEFERMKKAQEAAKKMREAEEHDNG